MPMFKPMQPASAAPATISSVQLDAKTPLVQSQVKLRLALVISLNNKSVC